MNNTFNLLLTCQYYNFHFREFLAGDKKMRKMSRDMRRFGEEDMNKYSRSFKKGNIDPMTFRLKVSNTPNLLSPVISREASPNNDSPRKLSLT